MNVHRVVVQAGIGELRAIPVWRSLLQLGVQVGAWKVYVDRQHHEESLSVDLVNLREASVDELRFKLQSSLPSAMSVDVRKFESRSVPTTFN